MQRHMQDWHPPVKEVRLCFAEPVLMLAMALAPPFAAVLVKYVVKPHLRCKSL